jgi:hypothetical protein
MEFLHFLGSVRGTEVSNAPLLFSAATGKKSAGRDEAERLSSVALPIWWQHLPLDRGAAGGVVTRLRPPHNSMIQSRDYSAVRDASWGVQSIFIRQSSLYSIFWWKNVIDFSGGEPTEIWRGDFHWFPFWSTGSLSTSQIIFGGELAWAERWHNLWLREGLNSGKEPGTVEGSEEMGGTGSLGGSSFSQRDYIFGNFNFEGQPMWAICLKCWKLPGTMEGSEQMGGTGSLGVKFQPTEATGNWESKEPPVWGFSLNCWEESGTRADGWNGESGGKGNFEIGSRKLIPCWSVWVFCPNWNLFCPKKAAVCAVSIAIDWPLIEIKMNNSQDGEYLNNISI